MTQWITGRIVSNTHWTRNLFSLKVDADIRRFTAGQYINLALDVDGRRVSDPYSILSAPGERPLEFFLYTHLEGDLSTALARSRAGDTVWIESEAGGDFTLEQITPAQTLWLLATGTGVAPFVSMLKTDQPWQRFDHVILVYAARVLDDLCYTGVFDELRKHDPERFSFLPFLSREHSAGCLHGHIPAAIADGSLEAAAGRSLDPRDNQIMLCGNPGMIRDAVSRLEHRGFAENRPGRPGQLTFESYW